MKVRDRLRTVDQRVFEVGRMSTLRSDVLTNFAVAAVFVTIGVIVVLTGRKSRGWAVVDTVVLGCLFRCIFDLIRARKR